MDLNVGPMRESGLHEANQKHFVMILKVDELFLILDELTAVAFHNEIRKDQCPIQTESPVFQAKGPGLKSFSTSGAQASSMIPTFCCNDHSNETQEWC